MIYNVGIFFSFFLSCLAFFKQGRTVADVILGIWLLLIGLHASFYSFTLTHDLREYPQLLGLDVPLPFVHNPMFYLYLVALIKPKRLNLFLLGGHLFLPVLIYLMLIPLFAASTSYKIDLINRSIVFVSWSMVLIMLMALSTGVYAYLIQLELGRYHTQIKQHFSRQNQQQLEWVKIVFYAMIVAWLIILLSGVKEYIFASISCFVILIGYFGIRQTGVFSNRGEDETLVGEGKEKKKYSNSGLNAAGIQALQRQLLQVIEDEKPYLNQDLTLTELASLLQTHPNYLSQVLNDELGVNFYDFINDLRVKEFKKLVAVPENQKYTILALAYQSGFNSKASFNRNFKKITAQSPSTFLKEQKITLQ